MSLLKFKPFSLILSLIVPLTIIACGGDADQGALTQSQAVGDQGSGAALQVSTAVVGNIAMEICGSHDYTVEFIRPASNQLQVNLSLGQVVQFTADPRDDDPNPTWSSDISVGTAAYVEVSEVTDLTHKLFQDDQVTVNQHLDGQGVSPLNWSFPQPAHDRVFQFDLASLSGARLRLHVILDDTGSITNHGWNGIAALDHDCGANISFTQGVPPNTFEF